jgi:hypothetical protein
MLQRVFTENTFFPTYTNYEKEQLESEYQIMILAHAFVKQIQRFRAKYSLTIIDRTFDRKRMCRELAGWWIRF